ncbi:hypothetical protein [Streptomyces sp. B21-083]|uniref:hypothetical protein n=1 Tax=Streptomyces sp. B21-083 TaxID=3039410 RepID=UPI002FF3EB5E
MSHHDRKHQPKPQPRSQHHEEHPETAAVEVLREVEDAGTRVVDRGERRGKDREAADALTPNEH